MVTSSPLPAKQKTSWTSYVAMVFGGLFGLLFLLGVIFIVGGAIMDGRKKDAISKAYRASPQFKLDQEANFLKDCQYNAQRNFPLDAACIAKGFKSTGLGM